jgi:alpha-beta hydrolase superfamily lysophospholipase
MTRMNLHSFVVESLPGTRPEIVARSGVSRTGVVNWLNKMHSAGEVRICNWKAHPRSGPAMPVYALGAGEDAICRIKKLTKKERRLRYEAKAKKDGRFDTIIARQRQRHWVKKATKTPSTWFAALGAP